MPKSRTPIDYTPQFKGDIFRPKAVVESELAEVQGEQPPTTQIPSQKQEETPTKRTNEVTLLRSNERTNERVRVRHSFDVWQDQLLALVEIQSQIFNQTRKKPKLGELVQQALEEYITNHTARMTERSEVRTNERT